MTEPTVGRALLFERAGRPRPDDPVGDEMGSLKNRALTDDKGAWSMTCADLPPWRAGSNPRGTSGSAQRRT